MVGYWTRFRLSRSLLNVRYVPVKSKILVALSILAMISISTLSCATSKPSSKKTPEPVHSIALKQGDPAPFNGTLIDGEMFKILMTVATKECK